jgi:PKD repeat protein
VTSPPKHGSLSGEAPELTYAPEPGFSGEDAFAFRASDGRAESAEVTVRLTVKALPAPPVASIMATPISGAAPLTVRLDGSGSRCAAPPAAYAWSFGDGRTAAGPAAVTHTYSLPGDYVVELTVTDALARSHSTTTTVRVSSPAGAARPPDQGGKTEPPTGTGSATAAKPEPDPKDEGGKDKPDKPGKPDDPGKPDKPGQPVKSDKPDKSKKPPKTTPPKAKPPKDKD